MLFSTHVASRSNSPDRQIAAVPVMFAITDGAALRGATRSEIDIFCRIGRQDDNGKPDPGIGRDLATPVAFLRTLHNGQRDLFSARFEPDSLAGAGRKAADNDMQDRPGPPGPALCLVTELQDDEDGVRRIAAALDATSAVTLILTVPDGSSFEAARAGAIVSLAHDRNVAVLFRDDAEAARDADADGVHLTWNADVVASYGIARALLGAGSIVGVEAGASRHDAMSLGEAGADYVAFGPAAGSGYGEVDADVQTDLIGWWSDLFVVPSVAMGAETPGDAVRLADAGADFLAVRLPPDADTDEAISMWARAIVEAALRPSDAA